MRFLILTQYYAPEIGATQIRLGAIARTLKELGHEVEVITALPNYPTGKIFPKYHGRFYSKEIIHGVEVHRVWVYPATGAGVCRFFNYVSFLLTSCYAFKRISPADYVFVDSPPLFLSLPGYWLANLHKAKMIFNVADLWPDEVRELGLVKNKVLLKIAEKLEAWAYRVSYRINAVTEGILEGLIKKGVPENKIIFLPNGVDNELFQPRPPDLEVKRLLKLSEKKIILYAGGMGYLNGLETVLAAAKLLLHQENILFLFIGGGSEKPKLMEIAYRDALKNVLFLDPAPPEFVARLYSLAFGGLASIRDLPSFQGVRSAKMFPAMASGVPLVYVGVGEGPALVNEAEAGLVVPPGDPKALAEAVLRLADAPKLSAKLGANGRRYVEKHLSWEKLVRRWLEELLQDCSGQHY